MTTTLTPVLRCITFAFALLGLIAGVQAAATSQTMADAQARYREDMAVCNSGRSNQAVNVCRTEARNALAEARRGGLTDVPTQYDRNAVMRCSEFRGDDRAACETRVRNPSRLDGSVEAGGLLRESVMTTTMPAPAPSPMPTTAPTTTPTPTAPPAPAQ